MNELQTKTNTEIGFNNAASFELVQRAAKMLSSSTLVPKDYQGPGGMANCAIALNMANRMGADPLMVLQNLVIVHGRPTWSSQFLIATFNSCGRFSSIRYEFFGEKGTDSYGCRAVATELSTGEKLVGTDITIAIAKKEGWYGRNGSKWQTMPDQMLRYRAAAWFVRTVAPEISMGLHTQEEVLDTQEKEINPIKTKQGRSVDDILNTSSINDAEIIEEQQEIDFDDDYSDVILVLRECETIEDIDSVVATLPNDVKKALAGKIDARKEHISQALAQ